jgi:hypothetical protein
LDVDFVRQELEIAGYNDDLSLLAYRESVVGANENERQESVWKLDKVVPELLSSIKTLRDKIEKKVILKFFNENSKTFFLSLFQRNELKFHFQTLLDNVQSFICDGEVCDVPLTIESCLSDKPASRCGAQVFVDLVYMTFENEELTRYTQLVHIAAFFQSTDEHDSAKLCYDSEVIPIVLEIGDRVIKSTARKKLADASRLWRGNETGGFVR